MHVYFKSITLENVRCFGKKQRIDFTDKDGKPSMWNLILGDNGTGKTTVLIGITTTWPHSGSESSKKESIGGKFFNRQKDEQGSVNNEMYLYSGEDFIKIIHTYLSVGVKNVDVGDNIRVKFVGGGGSISLELKDFEISIFAYGAARYIGTSGITNEQRSPLASLLVDNLPLLNVEEWLVQAEYLSLKDKNQPNLFEQVKSLLLRLFDGEISDIKIETNANGSKKISVLFLTNYGWVPLHQLSLGYKTLLAWMVDFARGLFEKYPDSPNPLAEPAVCLVDEIDLHLHPRFQRKMIQFLKNLFPKTQFIVTAHSPLVAQAAVNMDDNLILLRRKDDEIEVVNEPEVVKRWRIDQLLASDLFGVLDEKMERRRDLLRQSQRSTDDEKELESLESELHIIPPDSEGGDLGKEILEYLRQQLPAAP